MHEARNIAKWFIAFAEANDAERDQLKIQKLLYFAQGHYLGLHGQPLFSDAIEAWAHGPMVPRIHHDYKSYGTGDIDLDESDDFNFGDIDEDTTEFLLDVWSRYAKYDNWWLRNMTHGQAPWRGSFEQGEPRMVISTESMKAQFART